MLFHTALCGQTAVLRVLMARDAMDLSTPATLLVFEGKEDSRLSQGFRALLQADDLKALQVPLRVFPQGGYDDQRLSGHLGGDAKPHWLLVAQGDQILARGGSLPAAGSFALELAGLGFHDRVKELRTYLKGHPDSLEAHERLLALLRQRGEATALRFMGIEVSAPGASLKGGDLAEYLGTEGALPKVDLSAAKPLTPAQDLEAWGAFAQELDQALRSGIWRDLDLSFTRGGRRLDGASPTLLNLYQRALPEVEGALRQDPSSEPLWDLWIWMAQPGGNLRSLLASLTPSPLAPKGQWPPERAMRLLFATAHAPQDWRSLRDHFQDRWDGAPHLLRDRPPTGAAAPDSGLSSNGALLEQEWTTTLGPLLESTLRCGDAARADALLREALEASRWPGLSPRASAVARRCGQLTLASRWAGLRPGGP